MRFFVKIFQKVPKNGFFDLCLQKFACGAQNFTKTASLKCFRRAPKINSTDLKKVKIFENFLKIAPRENPRSAPDPTTKSRNF